MKKIKVYFFVSILSCCVNIAVASEFYILNPSSYSVGDTLGEDLVVKQAENGDKYLTARSGRLGIIEFPISLLTEFELSVNADWKTFSQNISIDSDETIVRLIFIPGGGGGISFGSGSYPYTVNGWQDSPSVNDIRFVIKDGIANLYINGALHGWQKIKLDNPNSTFTKTILLKMRRGKV